MPLAPDETYYWIWSQALAPGYLDHPPMVALWIRAGTSLLGDTALGVRIMGPLAAALASWMLYDAANRMFPGGKTGLVAVVLLNASLLLGVGTVIMTPDSPLLFFWTATFWAMARLAAGGPAYWWLVAGVSGGMALDSKYTALLLWAGIGLWALLFPSGRRWLRRWQPWAGCAIGFALFLPVVWWNAGHGWVGFLRQGGRVNDWHPARAAGFLAELLGGQIGLATPLIWLLCMVGLIEAVRRTWRRHDPCYGLLLALSLPPILVFVQHAFGDRVQGNWPAIIYPALTVAAATAGVRTGWWAGASALGFLITLLAYLQAATGLIPLPIRLDPVAMRLAGWDALANQVETARKATGASFVAADGYALTSELAWWLPAGYKVVGTDARWRLFSLPQAQIGGSTGLLVSAAGEPSPALWQQAAVVGQADRSGAGVYVLYRVTPRDAGKTFNEVRR